MLNKLALLTIVIMSLVLTMSYTAFAKWDRMSDGDLEGYLRGMFFLNENKGWAVGDGGIVLSTNDGGTKWDKMTIEEVKEADLYKDLWCVHFIDDKNGWISGDIFRGTGIILYTKDGGKTWSRQSSGIAYPLFSVFFIDSKTGWAVGGNGTILGTQTSGSKWAPLAQGRANAAIGEGEPGYWDVHFITPLKGWVAGENGVIKMTSDGGKTWVLQASGDPKLNKVVTDSNLSGIDFVNENLGWVVGEGGVIANTTDGGNTWILQNSGGTEWMYGVDFVSETEGIASGEYGTVLHTTDGGKTWKVDLSGKQKGAQKITFYDVAFPKPNTAYAAGEWGYIFKYKP